MIKFRIFIKAIRQVLRRLPSDIAKRMDEIAAELREAVFWKTALPVCKNCSMYQNWSKDVNGFPLKPDTNVCAWGDDRLAVHKDDCCKSFSRSALAHCRKDQL